MQAREMIHPQILTDSQKRADSILALLQEMRLDEPVRSDNMNAIDRGIYSAAFFLRRAIRIAGFWSDFNTALGGGRDWISGYVGYALECSNAITSQDLHRASNLLLSDRCPSGAWGYSPRVPVDADSTSWIILFFQKSQTEWDSQKTVHILLGHQDELTGGIRTYLGPQFGIAECMGYGPQDDFSGWCSGHVCVTAAAVQALIACGFDQHHPSMEKLVRFIHSTQQPDGCWNSYWFHGKAYATAQCIRALLQIGETPESPVLQRAAHWIETTQLPDGSWNDGVDGTPGRVFDTALAVWAGLDLCAPASFGKAVAWLLEKQRPDGSWDSLPILRLPLPNEHAPWNIREWPETSKSLTQGICVDDHNRYFTTATALQALSAWRKRGTSL
ncbi:MAG: prenyltransferase/squalene oxidase repeat-containing protein [Anaerolineales bacterium]